MRVWSIALVLFCVAFFAGKQHAQAPDSQIYINVGQAQVKKSLLALTPLVYVGTQPTNRAHIEAGQNLYKVIYNDLSVSAFFEFVKPEAYLEDPTKVGLRPAPGAPNGFNFNNWKTIGTEFLIRAAYQVIGNELALEAYVYHVPTGRMVMGKNYKGPATATRRMGHIFSNDLVRALTGKRGMFISKIAATRQENKGKTVKEVYIMDWDGANLDKITSHGDITLSPAWSTKGDKVAYTAYVYHRTNKVKNSDLFIYDIASGKRFLVSYKKGMNSGAAFFPGDKEILLTLTINGSPDLYRMNSDGENIRQITNGPNKAMNVEAAVSPDGLKIAFSSDRVGRPMIFVMNADGTGVKRLTFAGRYNSTPAWSPDGKTLAFAALDSNHFDIFTIGADGSNLKRMTDARRPNGRPANNESPSWSPDGRHILFTSDRTGKYQLYIVSPDGTNERRITDDNYNWDKPKWSPFLD
jgi:TolB protein